jgi:hypothetical protein
VLQNIRVRGQSIHNNLAYWMAEAEKRYGKSIRYSEDLPLDDPVRDAGTAEGFLPITGKEFRVRGNCSPADAIRKFIQGSNTVCECEGLLLAVVFNAVLDVVSVPVFNRVFAGLEIRKGRGVAAAFLISNDKGTEADVQLGSFVYLVNTRRGAMTEYAQEGRVSSAAQGWNVVCVDLGPPKQYMGMGLSDTPSLPQAYSLDTIKDKMTGNYKKKQPRLSTAEFKRALMKKPSPEEIKERRLQEERAEYGTRGKEVVLLPSEIVIQHVAYVNVPNLLRLVKQKLRPKVLLITQ